MFEVKRSVIEKREEIKTLIEEIRSLTKINPVVMETANNIVREVKKRGDEAISELTFKFDGVQIEPGDFEIAWEEVVNAWDSLDDEVKNAMKVASGRIAEFAKRSLRSDWDLELADGLIVGELGRPLKRAGIYIPGGRYPYPSTVLMTGIPASVAGVEEIVFCVPPSFKGKPNPATIAAIFLVGKCRVFRIGGAQAIAALAFGTESVPKCDVIAGPGNAYVLAAKKIVSNFVRLDTEAGPSEIAIYIEDPRYSKFASADAFAQLEHDPASIAVIVSTSEDVLDKTCESLKEMGEELQADGRVFVVLCSEIDLAMELIDGIAPEHLELMTDDAEQLLNFVRSAGSIFFGPYSAVALGDYIAGPSHVLPTGGSASRLSGLNVHSFRRTMNLVSYNKKAFKADSSHASLLSELEGLDAHNRSLKLRNADEE